MGGGGVEREREGREREREGRERETEGERERGGERDFRPQMAYCILAMGP